MIRGKLRVNRHYMCARRRQRGISERRNGDVQVWMRRHVTVLGGIKRALEIINVLPDMNSPGKLLAGVSTKAIKGGELRQCRESQLNFRDRTLRAVITNLDQEA